MRLEIVKSHKTLGANYAEGITDFSVGLGLVRRVDHGGIVQRLALTDLGRAYHAANRLDLSDYRRFILKFSVLQFDADIYGLLLDMALDRSLPSGKSLQTVFANRTRDLRRERSDWLLKAFPNPQLREHLLVSNKGYIVPWIKDTRGAKIETEHVGADFARHHTSPRRGWAVTLGHMDNEGHLTLKGQVDAQGLRATNDRYFWLGPPRNWFQRLHVSPALVREPLTPAWNIIRPRGVGTGPIPASLIQQVAEFMSQAYPHMRLIRANQVPLEAVRPYVYFLESESLNYKVDEGKLFELVFKQYATQFAPMSKRSGLLGYYQKRSQR